MTRIVLRANAMHVGPTRSYKPKRRRRAPPTQAAAVIKDASENLGHRAALCWPKAGSANDHQNATTRISPSPCQTSPVVFHTLADNVEGNLDVMVASFLATQVRR